jgi:hypothetical protein
VVTTLCARKRDFRGTSISDFFNNIDVERTLETTSVYVSLVREAVIRRTSGISKTHTERCGKVLFLTVNSDDAVLLLFVGGIVVDDCPNVLKWLADHPRWTFHFTPTSASWLNAVEGSLYLLSESVH